VSETRPRLQGANLTAWELAQHGIPHTLFVDSASGLLMRRGDVDASSSAPIASPQRRRLQQDRHV
jgi:methylthioribose-1-phosphate isomerase